MILYFLLTVQAQIVDDQTKRLRQSCQSKSTGYYWDGQQCLKCKSPNCVCHQYGGCLSCHNYYYFDALEQDCFRCPKGCLECCKLQSLTEIICSTCAPNYINISGVCVEMIGCNKFTDQGFCTACEAGYFLQNYCIKCPGGCEECNSSFDCTICLPGYTKYLTQDENICVPCELKGCKTCTDGTCQNCLSGYYMSGSSCTACPLNCEQCTSSSSCDLCSDNYLVNEEQICKNCEGTFANCMTCTQSNLKYTCVVCQNGYYLENEQCLNCKSLDENVRRCDSLKMITQCMPGYLVLAQRYFENGISNLLQYLCIKNDYGCRQTNSTDGQCSHCLPGDDFKNVGNLTHQFLGCEKCSLSIPHCKNCGYDIKTKTQICIVCDDYYYSTDEGDECLDCSSQCINCDKDKCYECYEGYYLDENINQCVSCGIDKCISCSSVGVCTYCADLYGFLEGKCLPCQTGCKTCDYIQNTCSECIEGYYLKVKSCIKYPNKCLIANENGFCYQCSTEIDHDYTQDIFYDEGIQISEQEDGDTMFYKSVNGYCLKCSQHGSGSYFCPNECPVEQLNKQSLIMILLISIYYQLI